MLTSVVKIQVLRVMSQMYLTIHITMVFAGCTIVCLVAQYQKKMAKNCIIYGIVYWFEECSFGVVYVTQYFSFDIPYNAQIPII